MSASGPVRASPVLFAVAALCVALLAPSSASAQRVVAPVDSGASAIDYTGTAPMHDWTGTSRAVAGTLALDLDTPDSSRVSLRAPVASFDSGNDRRDAKMREVTEADTYPLVRFRATEIRPVRWGRSRDGHSGRWAVTGALTFHGRTHPIEATVDVRVSDDSVRARAQFPVSLTRFGVERPTLLWVAPIGDTIRIDARIAGGIQDASSPTTRLGDAPDGTTSLPRPVSGRGIRLVGRPLSPSPAREALGAGAPDGAPPSLGVPAPRSRHRPLFFPRSWAPLLPGTAPMLPPG
jgi:polyisoprenoid-binding protein YceI